MKLKAFHMSHWEGAATPPPNRDRQVAHVIVTTSQKKAAEAYRCTVGELNRYGGTGRPLGETTNVNNKAGERLAAERPGTLWWFDEHGDRQWRMSDRGQNRSKP